MTKAERIADLLRQLGERPSDPRLLHQLIDLFRSTGDPKSSARYCAELARAYARDGFFLKAVALLKQALKDDPKETGLYGLLASWYEALGVEAEAAASLRAFAEHQRTIGDGPGLAATLERLARLGASTSLPRQGVDKLAANAGEAAGSHPCQLCLRAHAQHVVTKAGEAICSSCARAVARFILQGTPEQRCKVWSLPPPGPRDGATDVPHRRQAEEVHRESPFEAFGEFKQHLQAVVDEAETHADLAVAYQEMSLLDDALTEAAEALRLCEARSTSAAEQALAILFHPRMLRADTFSQLRTLLFPD
jgi:tetratricopeptide (TPR) repeat protein